MQKSRNVSFDESKFYFENKIDSDEEEKVGDIAFFGKFLENITQNGKEALADPDWQKNIEKRV